MPKQYLKAEVARIDGKMVAIATDETVDRAGDSLKADKWNFKNFKKNPVLVWAHDYKVPPIGAVTKLRQDGKKTIFEPVFHGITPLSQQIKEMYEKGFMSAFSVGFIMHDSGELELLEVSAVPVPANQNAIMLQRAIEQEVNQEDKVVLDAWLKAFYEVEAEVLPADALKVEEKGPVADLIAADDAQTTDDLNAKWNWAEDLYEVCGAVCSLIYRPETTVAMIPDLVREAGQMFAALAATGPDDDMQGDGIVMSEYLNAEHKEGELRTMVRKTVEAILTGKEVPPIPKQVVSQPIADTVRRADEGQDNGNKGREAKKARRIQRELNRLVVRTMQELDTELGELIRKSK